MTVDALSAQEAMYSVPEGHVVLSGMQAIVRVITEQLRRDRASSLKTAAFVSGYPGSPIGGLDQELQRQRRLLAESNIVHLPGHNEELGATAVWGSQLAAHSDSPRYDGVIGVWYAKAPGLDRAADAIRHAQFVGTDPHGGVLAWVGDDPGAKSSSLPNFSGEQFRTLNVPNLAPGSIQEVVDLGAHGIALSRVTGLWTGMTLVANVADGVGSVSVSDRPFDPKIPTVEWKGVTYRPRLNSIMGPPATPALEEEVMGPRLDLAREYGLQNDLNPITVKSPNAWIGILVVGHMYGELMTAFEQLGLASEDLNELGVRVAHIRMPFPIHPKMLRSFAEGLTDILVVEEKRGLVEDTLKQVLYGGTNAPTIVGKTDERGRTLVPQYGQVDASLLAPIVAQRLSHRVPSERIRVPKPARVELPLLATSRTPFYCAGCPHSTGTKVPEGAHVGAGIGCHGMIFMMDPKRVGTIDASTHMGGEGAQWIGMSPFVELDHMFQNMGDGTYFHSGQLAIQAAVAAGTHVTYKVLVNDAIAMTGGQDPLRSDAIPTERLAGVLLDQGVKRVLITTEDVKRYRNVKLPKGVLVWDRRRIIEAQEILREIPGVTVLIHDQRCAAENRRDRKRGRLPAPTHRVAINERVCEGCGDCGTKSGCLAVEPVETEFGRKTQINQTLCNFDYSCVEGDCPSFMTVRPKQKGAKLGPANQRTIHPDLAARLEGPISEPAPAFPSDTISVRMPGIGGTGVVTASHILAVAALDEGKASAGLDQTGMSQKGGPVISDLRIGPVTPAGTSKTPPGSVDLLLAFDILGAASPMNVETLEKNHSVAVVSTSEVPTGEMVTDIHVAYPSTAEFRSALVEQLGSDHVHFVDAQAITDALLGSSIAANTFLLGVAFQHGAIPLQASSIEAAIKFNAAAVDANLAAFRAGRLWVTDQAWLRGIVSESVPREDASSAPIRTGLFDASELPDSILGIAERNAEDLIRYQNRRYAEEYASEVLRTYRAEQDASPGSEALTRAVANYLYKLMAYKDEYEVARLSLESSVKEQVLAKFGPDARVYWNLHPPILKALGLKRKLVLGPWFRVVFVTLRSMRRVRGTRLDPFGYAKVRRLERGLIREYVGDLARVRDELTADRLPAAVEFASAPDIIRGYEELKLTRIEEYEKAREAILANFKEASLVKS